MNWPSMLTQISREEFQAKYLLGRQVSKEGGRSYEARDSAGRSVIVHLLGPPDGPEAAPWFAALNALSPERRSGLLGAFQVDNEAVLVTELLPHVRSFAEWFAAAASGRSVSAQASPVIAPDDASGDPTVIIEGPAVGSSPVTESPAPPEPPAQGDVQGPDQGAGEFTRMFAPEGQVPVSPPPGESHREVVARFGDPEASGPQSREAAPKPQQPAHKDMGEFTRMFRGHVEDAPPPPPTQPEVKGPPKDVKPQAASANSGARGKETGEKGGEFTEFFGGTEGTEAAPRLSDTLIEGPIERGAPPREVVRDPPETKSPARPRIVWRDQQSKQPASEPEPEPSKLKVRWKQGEAAGAAEPGGRVQPDLMRAQPPSVPPKPTAPKPVERPASPPSQPPGQFTEIFGHELPPESVPRPPATPGPPKSEHQVEQPRYADSPPSDTGPRKSVGDQPSPLSALTSDDYLQALGGQQNVGPPRAAPAPQPPAGGLEYTPDLPPPVSRPQPPHAPGPSDYTRVVSGRPAVPPPSALTPAPDRPREMKEKPAPAKAPTWLWVALAAIVLIMVLLIVLVVLT